MYAKNVGLKWVADMAAIAAALNVSIAVGKVFSKRMLHSIIESHSIIVKADLQ